MATDPAPTGQLLSGRSRLRSAIERQFLRREMGSRERRQRAAMTPAKSKAAYDRAMSVLAGMDRLGRGAKSASRLGRFDVGAPSASKAD
jgi:hypothetical protein